MRIAFDRHLPSVFATAPMRSTIALFSKALRRRKHDARPQRQTLPGPPAPNQALQFPPLRPRQQAPDNRIATAVLPIDHVP